MDTESQSSNKRSRTTDRCKQQPTLDPTSSPELSRRSFLSAFEQATANKITGNSLSLCQQCCSFNLDQDLISYIVTETLETKKLELKATKLEWEKRREEQKLEFEKHREEQKQELEQQKLAQESEWWKSEREDRSLQWKVEMEERRASRNAQIIQAGLEKGHTIEQIKELLDFIRPTQFNK